MKTGNLRTLFCWFIFETDVRMVHINHHCKTCHVTNDHVLLKCHYCASEHVNSRKCLNVFLSHLHSTVQYLSRISKVSSLVYKFYSQSKKSAITLKVCVLKRAYRGHTYFTKRIVNISLTCGSASFLLHNSNTIWIAL